MSEWLKQNIEKVQRNIAEAAERSGRRGKDIKLVAVSKTVDIEIIRTAFGQGLTDFGENRVQELIAKHPELPQANWHLIGHLQRNKIKYITDKVVLVHSLDSVPLGEELSRRALAGEGVIKALIQVNVAQEETKFGISLPEVEDFINQVKDLPGLKIEGLMTIAPYLPDPEEVRGVFRKLKGKFEKLKTMGIPGVEMNYLSMGMSNDYKVAIEEGSNMVRIGSSIFGERN